MNKKTALLYSLLVIANWAFSQKVSGVYKIDDLLKRIKSPDTSYVVNFWATWCKPCVQELPAFDSLNTEVKGRKIKILLVCIDFKEELEKKVNPFLLKKNVQAECVLLDEVNGNDFINKIDLKWSGAIPATLFKKGDKSELVEKKMGLSELRSKVGGRG